MRILCIDYGLSKVGLAIAEGPLAEPWQVIKTSELKKILEKESFDKVVVGVSEGEMGEMQKKFAREIGAEAFDETLSTKEANTLAMESGMSRKKRRSMEDAFSATIILQNYLDSKS